MRAIWGEAFEQSKRSRRRVEGFRRRVGEFLGVTRRFVGEIYAESGFRFEGDLFHAGNPHGDESPVLFLRSLLKRAVPSSHLNLSCILGIANCSGGLFSMSRKPIFIMLIILGSGFLLASIAFWFDTLTSTQPVGLGKILLDSLATILTFVTVMTAIKEKKKIDSERKTEIKITGGSPQIAGENARNIQTSGGDYIEKKIVINVKESELEEVEEKYTPARKDITPLLVGVVIDLSEPMLKALYKLSTADVEFAERLSKALNLLVEKSIAYCKTPL